MISKICKTLLVSWAITVAGTITVPAATLFLHLEPEGYYLTYKNKKSANTKKLMSVYDRQSEEYILNNKKVAKRVDIFLDTGHTYDFTLDVKKKSGSRVVIRKSIYLTNYVLPGIDNDYLDWYVDTFNEWKSSDAESRRVLTRSLLNHLCSVMEIRQTPILLFDDIADDSILAYYTSEANTVCINNEALLDNNMSLLGTLAHELRHAWQFQYVNTYDDEFADALESNYINYVEAADNMDSYKNQLVEKDATDFALPYTLLNDILCKRKIIIM